MPHKNRDDRNRVRREWKYHRTQAINLLRDEAAERGEPRDSVTHQTVDKAVLHAKMAEVKRLIREGVLPPPGQIRVKKKALPPRPPDLPKDTMTVRLEDPKQLPDELVRFGHQALMVFFEELPVVGDLQITAYKNGLPLYAILRRCQEGEVDHREGRQTWNAALFRKIVQAVSHSMAFSLLNVRKIVADKDVDARTRLRAAEVHLRMAHPDRFGQRAAPSFQFQALFANSLTVSSQQPSGLPVQGQQDAPLPTLASVAVGPTEEDLDAMAEIPLGDLQVTLELLRRGELS